MDIENYDQIEITENLIGDQKFFLQNGMQVNLEIVEEKPVGISLPEQVVQEVVETEAVVKGQTASSSYKPAILKNGLRVMVPPHIEVGVKILVSTLDCTYVGKHKL
jgi:elongation factor P